MNTITRPPRSRFRDLDLACELFQPLQGRFIRDYNVVVDAALRDRPMSQRLDLIRFRLLLLPVYPSIENARTTVEAGREVKQREQEAGTRVSLRP